MATGFHQIPIVEDSIPKTALVTPDGHYEYVRRVPFAPAVFQIAISQALGPLKDSIALEYLDDILIPCPNINEGLHSLEQVLKAI